MFLHDWADDGLFSMISDFENIYISKSDYEATDAPYANVDHWLENKSQMKAIMSSGKYDVDILLASYAQGNYSGDAFVLYRKDGSLYEVNASHCSCYGLEGQWEPEDTCKAVLMKRLDDGYFGKDDWCGNEFHEELRGVLLGLEDE